MILVNDTCHAESFLYAVLNQDLIISSQERAAHTTPQPQSKTISAGDTDCEVLCLFSQCHTVASVNMFCLGCSLIILFVILK